MPDRGMFTVVVEMHVVAEGDATDLAQRIWNENAEDIDANLGNFSVRVLRGGPMGFDIDWQPMEAS